MSHRTLPLALRRTLFAVCVAAGAVASARAADDTGPLAPAGIEPGSRFGASLAFDGATLICGSPNRDTPAGGDAGGAFVFGRETGGDWTEGASLVQPDPLAADRFGVSLSLDGDTLAIGASDAGGRVLVYARSGANWTFAQELEDPGAFGFGGSVALSGDTLAVGAAGTSLARGSVTVFRRSGGTWAQEARLTASDALAQAQFGNRVALAGDTLVVAAPGMTVGANAYQGKVYVLTRSGGVWSEQAGLVVADGMPFEQFGSALALSGNTLLAGCPSRGAPGIPNHGAAFAYVRSGTAWTLEAELLPPVRTDGSSFGTSVALDGDLAVLGAPGADAAGANAGMAYAFRRSGGAWRRVGSFAPADIVAGEQFGRACALRDGVAAVSSTTRGANTGAVWVFTDLERGPAFLAPKKVRSKVNADAPAKSVLTASGVLNCGTGEPDFSGPATLDVGGFHFDLPALTQKGSKLAYTGQGLALTLRPSAKGSSKAVFSLKLTGDPSGKVDPDGPLDLAFACGSVDARATVTLAGGATGKRSLRDPELTVSKLAATLKGAGKDTLRATLGFASDGIVPAAGEDLSLDIGAGLAVDLSGSAFVRKGDTWVLAGPTAGLSKVVVNYAAGTITIAGAGLSLGDFAAGSHDLSIGVTLGDELLVADVRVASTGKKLTY